MPQEAAAEDIMKVMRDVAYIQWDPINILAPSHLLSLWNRVGNFKPALLEKLMWDEKRIFETWTPIASLVLMEDYPLYHSLMKRYPESLSSSWGSQREAARKFLTDHSDLRKRMLDELRNGPLLLGQFSDHVSTKKSADGWTPESKVSRMLPQMHMMGDVMVVGHQGGQNLWGLTEEFLPEWVDRTELSEDEFEREAIQRVIKALGTASPREVNLHYVRGRYNKLRRTLNKLLEESLIQRVSIPELGNRDERYILAEDASLLGTLASEEWKPRISLLPPFDNLNISTDRTDRLFGFHYVREQFLPKEKRKFGTYVLPILWGDQFIGRMDPYLDGKKNRLVINAVYAELGTGPLGDLSHLIAEKIDQLSVFLGASETIYSSKVPDIWKHSLK